MPGEHLICERQGRISVFTINRPERRNSVDLATARALHSAFKNFETDEHSDVAILTGAQGVFCAGADLKALAQGERKPIQAEGDFAPMGPTRLRLSKPVIAAIEGHAVAGGMELALWCDMRVASRSATLGIFNRRFGVPLIDLGTIRLPRLIGQSRAMDLILTGRAVGAEEALAMGLVNRVVEDGSAATTALALAKEISGFPQVAMRNDRLSVLEQWGLGEAEAGRNELNRGLTTIASGESVAGAQRFSAGAGRHGSFSGG
jgi:enoyl-CoA hydratase